MRLTNMWPLNSRSNWNLEMLVFEEGGKPENPEKTFGARTRTNNKLNPHMTPSPGIEPGPHWWEASALTTAPPLLPKEDRGRVACSGLQYGRFVMFTTVYTVIMVRFTKVST